MERYRIPKRIGDNLVHRKKEVVVVVRPYCSPDPKGRKYKQYCRQKLMVHQPFGQVDELLRAYHKHSSAYHQFLRCGSLELEERAIDTTDNDEKVKKYLHSYPY